MQNDGTLFTVGDTNLEEFLESSGFIPPDADITADIVRSFYPGQNDSVVIADTYRDAAFLW